MALNVVLRAAVAVGTATAVVVTRYIRGGWYAGARTGYVAGGAAADVNVRDCGCVGGWRDR